MLVLGSSRVRVGISQRGGGEDLYFDKDTSVSGQLALQRELRMMAQELRAMVQIARSKLRCLLVPIDA